MKHRGDHRFLKSISKKYGIEAANHIASIPLISIDQDDCESVGIRIEENYIEINEEELGPQKAEKRMKDWLQSIPIALYRFDSDYFILRVYKDDKIKGAILMDSFFDNEESPDDFDYIISVGIVAGKNPELFVNPMFETDDDEGAHKRVVRHIEESQKNREVIIAAFQSRCYWIAMLSKWIEDNGVYPVSEKNTGVKPKTIHKKRPWLRQDLVSIRFLNRFPTTKESREHQGGTHRSPIKHFRRGHTRTLRAEKYRNHPLFMVENAIRVRESWAGSEEAVINGVEYRLIKPRDV